MRGHVNQEKAKKASRRGAVKRVERAMCRGMCLPIKIHCKRVKEKEMRADERGRKRRWCSKKVFQKG